MAVITSLLSVKSANTTSVNQSFRPGRYRKSNRYRGNGNIGTYVDIVYDGYLVWSLCTTRCIGSLNMAKSYVSRLEMGSTPVILI